MFEKRSSTRRRFLAGSPAALLIGAVPAAAMMSADSELIGLGRELKAAWDLEMASLALNPDVDCEAAKALVERIAVIPATTIQGLVAKATAVLWCHGDKFSGFSETTDERVAAGIIRDLLAMTG